MIPQTVPQHPIHGSLLSRSRTAASFVRFPIGTRSFTKFGETKTDVCGFCMGCSDLIKSSIPTDAQKTAPSGSLRTIPWDPSLFRFPRSNLPRSPAPTSGTRSGWDRFDYYSVGKLSNLHRGHHGKTRTCSQRRRTMEFYDPLTSHECLGHHGCASGRVPGL